MEQCQNCCNPAVWMWVARHGGMRMTVRCEQHLFESGRDEDYFFENPDLYPYILVDIKEKPQLRLTEYLGISNL